MRQFCASISQSGLLSYFELYAHRSIHQHSYHRVSRGPRLHRPSCTIRRHELHNFQIITRFYPRLLPPALTSHSPHCCRLRPPPFCRGKQAFLCPVGAPWTKAIFLWCHPSMRRPHQRPRLQYPPIRLPAAARIRAAWHHVHPPSSALQPHYRRHLDFYREPFQPAQRQQRLGR